MKTANSNNSYGSVMNLNSDSSGVQIDEAILASSRVNGTGKTKSKGKNDSKGPVQYGVEAHKYGGSGSHKKRDHGSGGSQSHHLHQHHTKAKQDKRLRGNKDSNSN